MALFRLRDRSRNREKRDAWKDVNAAAVAKAQALYNMGAKRGEAYAEYRSYMQDFARVPVSYELFVGVYLET